MDVASIAGGLTAILAPLLPYLLKLGDKAAEETGAQVGGDAWNLAKSIWTRIGPRLSEKTASQEVVADVAANPVDHDTQAALRLQLKKLLTAHPDLAQFVVDELSASPQAAVAVTGDRNVTITGSNSGSTIITGDHNHTS